MEYTNLKRCLLLSTFCSFIVNTQLSAEDIFSLDDFSYKTYTKHYNALPPVEDTDQQIQSVPKFNPFLKQADEVVTRYGLESHVGLRLIHSHFTLPENKIMSDSYEKFKGIPSLVTYAHTAEEACEKKALPSSWIFKSDNQDDVQIFEASSDSAVREGIKLIENEPEFMQEMARLLAANDLNSLLSLAVLRRSSLEPTHDDQQYVEINDSSLNKSVVQLWDSQKIPENTIRTSWSFKGPRQQRCWPSSVCVWQLGTGHWHSTKHNKT